MEELQKQHGAAPLVALSVPLTWIQPNIASYLSNAQSSLFLNHSWEKDFYYIWFPLRCSKICQTSLLEIFPAIWWDINLSFNWIPLFPGILLFPFTNKFCFLCANSFMSSVSLQSHTDLFKLQSSEAEFPLLCIFVPFCAQEVTGLHPSDIQPFQTTHINSLCIWEAWDEQGLCWSWQ